MRIGKLAKKLSLNPKTLRYWEEVGLIPAPERNASGYRIYTEHHLEICRFILKAKSVGFTLEEIREILFISYSGNKPCGCVKEKIKKKISEIDSIMKELSTKRKLLSSMSIEAGEATSTSSICPIIDAVSRNIKSS